MATATPIGTIGGEAAWLLAISWATTGAAAVCFLLRLYTRLVVVKQYGWDDNIYNASFILLLTCTTMVQVSTLYGLGQDQQAIWESGHDRLTSALLYLIVAQIFGVATMGVAKVSLGLLLLRLVMVPWHRWAIWGAIGVLFVVTGVTSFVFAFQCSPPAYLWDKTIRGGHCPIPITPYAIVLGTACVAADLFFAIFPHLFVWRLNKPLRERALIAAAMSLGLVAAACGVKRTIGLGGLASDNYTLDAVPTCAWSIAELAITLVCIAVPVCLPLWKHMVGRLRTRAMRSAATTDPSDPSAGSGSGLSAGRKNRPHGGVFALRTFGGSPITGLSSKSRRTDDQSKVREGDAESERALRQTPSPDTQHPRGGNNASKTSLPVVTVFVESPPQKDDRSRRDWGDPRDMEGQTDLERQ